MRSKSRSSWTQSKSPAAQPHPRLQGAVVGLEIAIRGHDHVDIGLAGELLDERRL